MSKGRGEISDGFHTFDELYEQRAVLFAALCNTNRKFAWKARIHADGSMYPGMFIAGMSLPGVGDVSYHLEEDTWGLFRIPEQEHAPHFTGYTPADVIERIAMYFCEEA